MNKKRIFTTYDKLALPMRHLYHQKYSGSDMTNVILVKQNSKAFYAVMLESEDAVYLVKLIRPSGASSLDDDNEYDDGYTDNSYGYDGGSDDESDYQEYDD